MKMFGPLWAFYLVAGCSVNGKPTIFNYLAFLCVFT